MNEYENHQFPPPDQHTQQAPLSLVPMLLAQLGLDQPRRVPDTSLEGLRKALQDPAWMVRAATVQVLAEMEDRESFALLLSALLDEDASVQACAVCILGKRGDRKDQAMIEQLETALRDPTWHVRESAVYALGAMNAFASIVKLREVLNDSDAEVRRAATQVIERLQSLAPEENPATMPISGETIQISQLPHTFTGIWPQWIRRSVARLLPRSHPTIEKGLAMLHEKQSVTDESISTAHTQIETLDKPVAARLTGPRRPWLRVLEQGLAVLLVLGIAISWFAIAHLPRSSGGAPAVFSDTNTRPLGAPAYTIQGNLSYLYQWSGDSRTFYYLQVDALKQQLEVRMLDTATGRTTTYPVLDSSWIGALQQNNIDQVGHYLVALRPLAKNQATLEIWDITGQRAITTQTVPASIGGGVQVISPLLASSDNEQKFAMFSPDGTVTIWDIASGHKPVTLEGKAPYVKGIPPAIKWYNHDHNLLFFGRSDSLGTFERWGPLETWNTATGTLLFNLHDTSRRYFEPSVSPDGKYLALTAASRQSAGSTTTTARPDTLEILDAHSGQVLHIYHLKVPGGTGVNFIWLSDSQRLLIMYMPINNSQVHIHIMNAFTGQTTFDTFSTYTGFEWLTPDGQYLMLGSSDSSNSDNSRSMQIWQTSSGRLVTTIATPGMHPNPYSYFGANNQYMLIGEKSSFDIWDIATGKLLYKYHGFTPFTVAGNGGSNVFWSPDGKYLTMIAWKTSSIGDGTIAIWRMP